jgi:hypothetical protein
MAVMAVMLTISGTRSSTLSPRVSPTLQNAFVAIGVVSSVLGSLAITIVLFGIHWYRRGLPFFTQPGQWLLVAIAAGPLLRFVGQGAYQIVRFSDGIRVSPILIGIVFGLASLGMLVAGFALDLYIARRKIHLQAWRRVFYARAIAHVVPLFGDVAVALLLERAVRANRRNHPLRQMFAPTATTAASDIVQYHWTHRAGVVLQFLHIGLEWLIVFAMIGMLVYGTK